MYIEEVLNPKAKHPKKVRSLGNFALRSAIKNCNACQGKPHDSQDRCQECKSARKELLSRIDIRTGK